VEVEATGDRRVEYVPLMLYLATADTLEAGVDKAFHVMARAPGHLPGAALEWEAVQVRARQSGPLVCVSTRDNVSMGLVGEPH